MQKEKKNGKLPFSEYKNYQRASSTIMLCLQSKEKKRDLSGLSEWSQIPTSVGIITMLVSAPV